MNALVVYYSRTGKTKFVAEKIALELGAEIEEIVDLKKRDGWFGFLKAGFDATLGRETKIGGIQKSPKDFDLIVVGTPVWNSRPSSAIRTYLNKNDLSNKKAAIFCTNEGVGKEAALDRTKDLAPEANVVGELVLSKVFDNREENENKISNWCSNLSSL